MAITTNILMTAVINEGTQVMCSTTDTAYPGETHKFSRIFDDVAKTDVQIKDDIIAVANTYWLIRAFQDAPLS